MLQQQIASDHVMVESIDLEKTMVLAFYLVDITFCLGYHNKTDTQGQDDRNDI